MFFKYENKLLKQIKEFKIDYNKINNHYQFFQLEKTLYSRKNIHMFSPTDTS